MIFSSRPSRFDDRLHHPARLIGRLLPIVLLTLLRMIAGSDPLHAQSISLYQIDPSNYPEIRAKVIAVDADGDPVRLSVGDLTLTEEGIPRRITFLDCPEPKPIEPISSVLTIDISSSMYALNGKNLDIARAAARAWIEAMPLGISECAVTSFNAWSYLNQDFTIDARRLLRAVDALTPTGSTSYNEALIAPITGAIPVALKGKHRRVVVFLTDGRGGGNEEVIVQQALAGGVTIYCITVGLEAPDILKNIAERTGGLWFENVNDPKSAADIYRMILGHVQGGEPCSIAWESGPACDPERVVTLAHSWLPASVTTTYTAPPQSIIDLTLSTDEVRFGVIQPGRTAEQTVRLSAGANPVTITGISSSDPSITVVANGAPPSYTIPANAWRDVTLRFAPSDSLFHYAEITVLTEGCAETIYASGGNWGAGTGGGTPPDIRLVTPNGGERFPVGSIADVRWSGVLPSDTVRLEVSTDAGASWQTIADRATGLLYKWRVQNWPSERCLARVSIDGVDTGSGGGGPFARALHTYTVHADDGAGPITGARFSPDGVHAATATGLLIDKLRIWKTRDGGLYRSETPAGRVSDLDYSGDGSRLAVATDESGGRVKVYPSDGSAIRSINAPGATVVALSEPDGGLIAVGDASGSVGIWNIDGTFVRTITAASLRVGPITDIDFNPTTNQIAIVGSGTSNAPDTIKIYDTQGRERAVLPRIASTTTHTLGITSVRFSRDGTRMVTAGNEGDVYVWDPLGGAPLFNVDGYNDAAFTPDGGMIVTGGGDVFWSGGDLPADGQVYDAASGMLIATLRDEHAKAITKVDMTIAGGRTYALTAGRDGTAVVWEIGTDSGSAGGAASDISDALWAIVDAEIGALSVDFGQRVVGSRVDSTVIGAVVNSGGVTVRVDEMTIAGADRAAFEVVSGHAPFILAPGEEQSVEFRFAPDRVGPFNATLEIVSAVDTLRPTLRGVGVMPQLRIDATMIDFGLVELGSRKDSLVTAVVTNVGTLPITIDDVRQGGPDLTAFTIITGEGPFTLQPGASHPMQLRFTPSEIGRRSGSLLFIFNGPGSPAVVQLFGEGFCRTTIARTHAVVGDMHAAPGDTVALTMSVALLDPPAPLPPGPGNGPLDFTAHIRFDGTMLAPLDAAAIVTIEPRKTVAAYRGRWDPSDQTILWLDGDPTFVAGLGAAETTPVVVEEFLWETGCAPDLAIDNALFTLDSLCRDGESVRLFDGSGGMLKMEARSHRGDGLSVTIGLIEPGETRLSLLDLRGERVALIADGPMDPGERSATIDVRGLATGTYFLLLETPTGRLLQPVVIGR